MLDINICSPIWNELPGQTYSVRVARIFFAIDLLLLFVTFTITRFLLKKQINDLKLLDDDKNLQTIKEKQNQFKKWDNTYLMTMADHIVAVGFSASFSPYAFQLIIAMAYMGLVIWKQISMFIKLYEVKQLKTVIRLLNMLLLLCSMVGLSRTASDGDGICRDYSFRV